MWLLILFSMGLLHGIGPDHLAAITAFGAAVGGEFRRLVAFSVRFAVGHALVLGAAGVLGKAASLLLPARWERIFEISGGVLLLTTGLVLLGGLLTGKINVHAHHHSHSGDVHRHFHLHLFPVRTHSAGGHEHAHGSAAVGLGALFAMGGARSLLTIAPIALAQTFTASLVRVAVFCLGIVVSMVAYAWVTQRALMSLTRFADGQHNRTILQVSAYVVAVFCLIAGTGALLGRF